ncbi:hypothetical protein LYSHEL_27730 [Lysobacter helvus]|uniref:DUF1508 domain-containing protein n=3 Tax=Lysobacterales TaxID=135614 RepID=A0ABN6FVJ3_9GAMM|nr:hypothetical protein LYSCAS_27700 [Lysobacter caseinilyticus]BCT96902.1 hypothetical protein LYSHEL_27730 [Lysobacter helvus]
MDIVRAEASMGFEVYQHHDLAEWRWRLFAVDGLLATGGPYPSLDDCLEAIRLVQGTNTSTPVFDAKTGSLVPQG